MSNPREIIRDEILDTVNSLPDVFDIDTPSSKKIAPIIEALMVQPSLHSEAGRLLTDRLLDLTVRVAADHVSYYSTEEYKSDECWTAESISEIQPVSRDEVAARRSEFISTVTNFAFSSFTSGTTNSDPLLIERSLEEQRYLGNLFSRIFSGCGAGLAPLGLTSPTQHHGSVIQIPTLGYGFVADLRYESGLRRAKWLLKHNFNLSGYDNHISSVSGTLPRLLRLTAYLEQNDFEPQFGRNGSIVSFGHFVPKICREWLSSFWGVLLTDNYSLTEIIGSASFCEDCQGFHFNPLVHAETVSLSTGKTIETGLGELVLTSLFPFTQRFPLIRYRTGDLVTAKKSQCEKGTVAYQIRGRIANSCCLDQKHSIWVGSCDIINGLSQCPDVSVSRTSELETECLSELDIGGKPRFLMTKDDEQECINLQVGTKFPTSLYEVRSENLKREVRQLVAESVDPTVIKHVKNPSKFRIQLDSPVDIPENKNWLV